LTRSTASTSTADLSTRRIGLVWLCVCALGVGALTGLGAVVLRALIALFHNLFFLGQLSFVYDSNIFDPPNPWGPWMILVPVVGGLIVVFLVRTFAPEARGHGVPEVMDAIYYKDGRIRMAVIFIKSLASAISIGSGASVGREGPIIQIGSGIGSTAGRFLRLPTWQIITLIAAGAGSGIAATFNTPLGGVMFALELMLPEVSSRTFLPVVIATGAATYIGWLFFDYVPAFQIPPVAHPQLSASGALLLLCVALGALCGVAAAAFVRTLSFMEDLFDRMPGNAYTRNIAGMLLIGVLIYALEIWSGHRHVDGVGYATVQWVLSGGSDVAWFLGLLFVLKLLATTVSLGSGASGGVFSPSLFLGAMLGGAFGAAVSALWPQLGIGVEVMALIGMAAVVGSGTGAAMTAILMIFEMTHAYATIVPSIVAVAIALGVRRTLSYENIYTIKLARRGHHIPRERHSHMFMIRHAGDVMLPVRGIVDRAGISAAAAAAKGGDAGYLIVRDGNHIAGLLKVGETIDPGETVVDKTFVVVRSSDFIRDIMSRMAKSNRKPQLAIVVDRRGVPRPQDALGVVTRAGIADTIIGDLSK
jgi:CIC family chloride channel protein